MKNKILLLAVLFILSAVLFLSFTKFNTGQSMNNSEAISLIKDIERKVVPIMSALNLAYFDASVSGKMEDYQKAAKYEMEVSKIYTDKQTFQKLKTLKESNSITDPLVKRQVNLVYHDFLRKQIDTAKLEKMINISTEIEHKFSTFRAKQGDKALSDNEVEKILQTSTDIKELEAVWLASKQVGEVVAEDIIQMAKLRNEVAREQGFRNYHEMELLLNEQDPVEVEKVFDELDSLTRQTFINYKDEIDAVLCKRLGIDKSQLMPWHYQNRFFQEAPKIYNVEFDKYYVGQDVLKLVSQYYKGIGINIDPIISNSDMYEKPGKNQHAFCTHIDKKGDVRILCNLKNNSYWMSTLLHEFGHGIYDMYIDTALPYFLRDPAHTFTTEAIAMLFGRFTTNPQWLQDMLNISDKEKASISEACEKSFKLQQIVFSRWAQVMYRFEKELYGNPDQDLNKVWWELVERYQMVKKPAGRNKPDWASKIHIATAPCYYHNYLLGEILASQLHYYIIKNVIKSNDYKNQSFVNNAQVGNYLIEKVFKPGNRDHWNIMIKNATGETLTAKYYAQQFVK